MGKRNIVRNSKEDIGFTVISESELARQREDSARRTGFLDPSIDDDEILFATPPGGYDYGIESLRTEFSWNAQDLKAIRARNRLARYRDRTKARKNGNNSVDQDAVAQRAYAQGFKDGLNAGEGMDRTQDQEDLRRFDDRMLSSASSNTKGRREALRMRADLSSSDEDVRASVRDGAEGRRGYRASLTRPVFSDYDTDSSDDGNGQMARRGHRFDATGSSYDITPGSELSDHGSRRQVSNRPARSSTSPSRFEEQSIDDRRSVASSRIQKSGSTSKGLRPFAGHNSGSVSYAGMRQPRTSSLVGSVSTTSRRRHTLGREEQHLFRPSQSSLSGSDSTRAVASDGLDEESDLEEASNSVTDRRRDMWRG